MGSKTAVTRIGHIEQRIGANARREFLSVLETLPGESVAAALVRIGRPEVRTVGIVVPRDATDVGAWERSTVALMNAIIPKGQR